MANSVLDLHSGGNDVPEEQLKLIVAPPPTETWFPISHHEVFSSVRDALRGAGYEIAKQRLSVAKDNHRFFGTLDLTSPIIEGITLAVGVRNSTDRTFPIGFCCGSRVFVCSNLAFTSEIVVSKKHTRFGRERYLESLSKAVASLPSYQKNAAHWINRLQQWELPEETANSLILRSYEEDIIGSRLLPQILEEWRNPPQDTQPRTGWSLWNSYTAVLGRTIQTHKPAEAALRTIRLQRLLQPPEVIDVEFTMPVEQAEFDEASVQ